MGSIYKGKLVKATANLEKAQSEEAGTNESCRDADMQPYP